jgi:hypothetical protein
MFFPASNSQPSETETFFQAGQTFWNFGMNQDLENVQAGASYKTAEEEIGRPYLSSTLNEKDDFVNVMSLSQAICISLELTENGLDTYNIGKFLVFIFPPDYC